jgi:hypothetical protein
MANREDERDKYRSGINDIGKWQRKNEKKQNLRAAFVSSSQDTD